MGPPIQVLGSITVGVTIVHCDSIDECHELFSSSTLLLWRIFTAIVFHASWRLRNDIHFRAAQADSPNIPSLLFSFRRHCKFVFKHADEFQIDGNEIAMVLRRLNFEDPTTIPEHSSGQRIWIPQA